MIKIARRSKAAIIFASLLLSIAGFTYLAHADLTTPLTACVDYLPASSGLITVGGKGVQQVFRLGSSAGSFATCSLGEGMAADFTGLNPKIGTCPPGGGTLILISGSHSDIGPKDFVYAIKIKNSRSNVPLDTILTGLCDAIPASDVKITSIGYCRSGEKFPGVFNRPPDIPGLDFFFIADQVIPVGESSVTLFWTSPHPPALAPTSIGSSGVSANGFREGEVRPPSDILPDDPSRTPIYAPCIVIRVDKKVGCAKKDSQGRDICPSVNDPEFVDDLQVISGDKVCYQITVTNVVSTPLDNVVITDPDLAVVCPLGRLEERGMRIKVFGPFPATSGIPIPGTSVKGKNTTTVTADYLIPDRFGNPIPGQTVPVEAMDMATLDVGTVSRCKQPIKCDTLCFRSPLYYSTLSRLPNGSIFVGGMNFNNPIAIQSNVTTIKNALQGGAGPMQQLNRGYVAAQLSLASYGGNGSPTVFNALWGHLSCYANLPISKITPVTLSNGFTFTPNSMVADLFEQARKAILANNASDMSKLAALFEKLNTCK